MEINLFHLQGFQKSLIHRLQMLKFQVKPEVDSFPSLSPPFVNVQWRKCILLGTKLLLSSIFDSPTSNNNNTSYTSNTSNTRNASNESYACNTSNISNTSNSGQAGPKPMKAHLFHLSLSFFNCDMFAKPIQTFQPTKRDVRNCCHKTTHFANKLALTLYI